MSQPESTPSPRRSGPDGSARAIDPRGPRFGASITAVLLLIVIVLGLIGASVASFVLLAVVAGLFAWGSFAGVARHPYGLLFKALIRPRLAAPAELEDPAPPTFAQTVGLIVTAVGLILQLVGLPYGLVAAAAAAFVAAFLNAVFGYCIGCQLYLLLVRLGLVRRHVPAV
ncbi:MAG: DUF4395 domain-containing protein [Microbacteriaceae bacterium]|nr:MAG: DUF4395 domain-containing protein [Microbacteriaceae bacterium]